MKVTGATTLRELQQLVSAGPLDVHINYLSSAAAYRVVVIGPNFTDATILATGVGIAANLGEAIARAFVECEEKAKETPK